MIRLLLSMALVSTIVSGCFSFSFIGSVPKWDLPAKPVRTDGGKQISAVQEKDIKDDESGSLFSKSILQQITEIPLERQLNPVSRFPTGDGKIVCAILAGDSWSAFDAVYKATLRHLKQLNQNCRIEPFFETAAGIKYPLIYPGTTARQWGHDENKELISKALRKHPSTNNVILYMGGNDFLRRYKASFSPKDLSDFIKEVDGDITGVIGYLKDEFPKRNLKFLISGYSAPNMGEKALEFSVNKKRWKRMEQPSVPEINNAFYALTETLHKNLNSLDYVVYIDNYWMFNSSVLKGTPPEWMFNSTFDWFFYCPQYLILDGIHLGKKAQNLIGKRGVLAMWCKGWVPEIKKLKHESCSELLSLTGPSS